MKTKYLLVGLCLSMIPMSISAGLLKDLCNAGKSIYKEYRKSVDSGKQKEIFSKKDRAKLDALASGGVGGAILVGASVVTNVHSSVTGKSNTTAKEVFENAISNYNDNNKVIEEKGWSGNNATVLNSVYSLAGAAEVKVREKNIAEANNAFFEMNKRYTDPNSSFYDPYFNETLKYDKNGKIIGRMDTYERINTIKEINKGRESAEWETTYNRVLDQYLPQGADREKFIEENGEKIKKEALSEMAQSRKERMDDYYKGNYNTEPKSESLSLTQVDPMPLMPIQVEPAERKLPDNIIISGYELNAVEVEQGMENQLDEVYGILSENPDYNVLIVGYTCDLGGDKINYAKGEKRAKNAKSYLVKKGVSENRISVESEGSNNPTVENSSLDNRRLNRRIEVIFNK